MKNLSLKSFLLICIAVITFSCSKEKETTSTTTTKSTKEILMASQWKKWEYKENGTVMPFWGSCEMDDVLSFTATDWVLDGGPNQCSFYTGSDYYVIESDNKTMRWTYGTGPITFNSTNTAFTFKTTGANTFEYTFIKK